MPPPSTRPREIEFRQAKFFERPRRPALLLWREVAIHAGAPRPDVADGVHPRARAILDAARSRILCIEPACNPISWRVKARQKPGSPGEVNRRTSVAPLTAHRPTVDTPSVNPPITIVDQAVGLPPRLAPPAAPYCATMIDLVENWTLLIVGCTAFVLAGVLAVLVVRHKEAQRRQLVAVSEVSTRRTTFPPTSCCASRRTAWCATSAAAK
jgi:hypothetical protein